ncbi:putative ABC transport system permease protein [Orenia metallireducens]|uniref:Putative ABC transport system permease protein n=1 Tax=Orenia metallireducens TaxID=1413210 RepID=A0A285F2I4_9FIRM|nr:FtsX-like permease family protein [Orenia metallireducens]PRX34755.1 putative ABC transport system permease protein [Orenia metallireducens]SNY05498.1 putative ABC transport system permease protein [Orenia metallireducens]
MFLAKLALKNLTRHKRRVLITASIIALGMAMFLIYDSIQTGLNELSFANIINLETGHIQVVDKEYWEQREKLPLKNLIAQSENLSSVIKEIPYFKAATPQLKFSANLNNGIDQLPVLACGIDSMTYSQVFTTKDYIIEGSMFNQGKQETILGKKLANLMDLKVGDYLTLIFKTKTNTFNTIDLKITGLLQTNNPKINENLVYLPLSLAQQSLNLEGKITGMTIRLKEDGVAQQVSEDLNQSLASLDNKLAAHSWRASAGEVIAMSKAETAEKLTIMSLILLMAAVGIVNTIILSSLERTKEIGMMKALGLKENEIIFIFMVEAMGIGLIGAILGSLLGSLVILYFNLYGINLTALLGGVGDWGLPVMGRLYGYWNLSAFIFVIAFGVIISLLSSILPARWVARKDPIEAMYGIHN